ncbi:MAG: hypothetical protein FWF36_06640 [Propionibacteriaceae bacterium]|nr:hypothetical protein [Propionibacteriaceae bacterium]
MFDYKATGDGRVFISWNHRVVVTLAGQKAAQFLEQADGLDDAALQLLIARATGNFRRGNERLAHSP